jgi:DNA modification methylase
MPITPGGLSVKKARVGSTRRGVQREIVEFSTCSICGAWKGALGTEVEVDDYIRHCLNVTAQLGAVLRDDGVMFWNIADSYDPARPKSLVGVPERMTLGLLRQGWIVRSSLVWSKPNPIPVTSNDRLYSAHEIVIIATKRKRYKWNHQKKYRLDVWEIGHPRIKGGNSAVFPPELPRRCVSLATDPGDVVLDPFAGSGTTLAIADLLGRKGLGFDVSKRFIRDYPVREAAIRAWYDREFLEK